MLTLTLLISYCQYQLIATPLVYIVHFKCHTHAMFILQTCFSFLCIRLQSYIQTAVWSHLDADVDSALFFFLECVCDTEGLQCTIKLLLTRLWPLATTELHLQPVWQDPKGDRQERTRSIIGSLRWEEIQCNHRGNLTSACRPALWSLLQKVQLLTCLPGLSHCRGRSARGEQLSRRFDQVGWRYFLSPVLAGGVAPTLSHWDKHEKQVKMLLCDMHHWMHKHACDLLQQLLIVVVDSHLVDHFLSHFQQPLQNTKHVAEAVNYISRQRQ